jgi:hypothetical protein
MALVKTKPPGLIELWDVIRSADLDIGISLWKSAEYNFNSSSMVITLNQTIVLGWVLKIAGTPSQNVYIPFWGKNVKIKNLTSAPWTNFLFELIENLKEQ